MVGQAVIVPVGDGESDGVNSLVIKEEPDDRLWICLDTKNLSKVIEREHRPVPTADDISPRSVVPHNFLSWMPHRGTGMFYMLRNHRLDDIQHTQGKE